MDTEFFVKYINEDIRCILAPREYSNIVAVKIYINVGSVNDGDNYGVTHFLEHLLFKKSGNEVFYKVEKYGGYLNGETHKDNMSISLVIANIYVYDVLKDVLELVFQFNVNKMDVESEKRIIMQEVLGSMNQTSAMYDLFANSYWQEGSISHPIRGYIENIDQIKLEQIQNQYEKAFKGNNIVVSIAGDINKNKMCEFLENYFCNTQYLSGHVNLPYSNEKVIHTPEKHIFRKTSLEHIFVAYNIPKYGHEDNLYLEMLSRVLASGVSTRLVKKLRQERKLVYSVEAKPMVYKQLGVFLIYTKCSLDNKDLVKQIISDEIQKLQRYAVSEDELDFLLIQYIGNRQRRFESMLSLASSLGIELLLTNKVETFELTLNRHMNVKKENLSFCANRYLNSAKTIVIGNN